MASSPVARRLRTTPVYAPNYVSYEPTSGDIRGIEGAKHFAAPYRQAFPDRQNTIEDMVAKGDKVVMRL
jgi:predicted ester cyclase